MPKISSTSPQVDRALKLVNDAMQILMGLDELAAIERQAATTDALRLLNSAKVQLTEIPGNGYDD